MKRIYIFLITLITIGLVSCDVLQQVSNIANLTACDFRMKDVEGLTLSGVNIQNKKSVSDLNFNDYQKLLGAVLNNNFPLNFTLNVEAKNPNTMQAGLSQLDFILFIDDIEMTRGLLNKNVVIPANNGVATIPMNFNFNLKEVLSGKSGEAILNFAMNLASSGNSPTRFMIKLKPSVNVNGVPISYPGYIDVTTSFSGKK